jgi:hypothetical protein
MQTIYLQIIHFLGDTGYYARIGKERHLLEELVSKGLLKIKRGTKCVFQLTQDGEEFISRELNLSNEVNYEIKDEEFTLALRKAYNELSTPMKPLVRIPDVRKKLNPKRIPDSIFNKKMIELHDQGVLTLQTALSKAYTSYGGIESKSGTGVFYYMMFEA